MNRASSSCMLALAALAVLSAAAQYAADIAAPHADRSCPSRDQPEPCAQDRAAESDGERAEERPANIPAYFPSITNESNALHITELQIVGIPAGAFGAVTGTRSRRKRSLLPQGKTDVLLQRHHSSPSR